MSKFQVNLIIFLVIILFVVRSRTAEPLPSKPGGESAKKGPQNNPAEENPVVTTEGAKKADGKKSYLDQLVDEIDKQWDDLKSGTKSNLDTEAARELNAKWETVDKIKLDANDDEEQKLAYYIKKKDALDEFKNYIQTKKDLEKKINVLLDDVKNKLNEPKLSSGEEQELQKMLKLLESAQDQGNGVKKFVLETNDSQNSQKLINHIDETDSADENYSDWLDWFDFDFDLFDWFD